MAPGGHHMSKVALTLVVAGLAVGLLDLCGFSLPVPVYTFLGGACFGTFCAEMERRG